MKWFQSAPDRSVRLFVVGDAIVDRYLSGEVSRISPEAPVPVLLAVEEADRPGGAANVAANVVAMGGTARLACIVGDDLGGRGLRRMMEVLGIEPDFVVDPGHTTTQKTRLISGMQQIVRIDREIEPSDVATRALLEKFRNGLERADFVILSDYAKGALRNLPDFLNVARRRGLRTLIDPKIPDPERYRGAFILKPNEPEFRALFGAFDEKNLARHALKAIRRFEIEHLVLTRGPRGMLLVSSDGTVLECPTEALEVFDVSGAGDTVAAALALAIAGGHSIAAAVRYSNIAAGIAVAHAGTYVVTRHDIELRLALKEHAEEKVLPRGKLATLLSARRALGQKVVFTNGCFDVLHPGHSRMLRAARAQGDLLVVGLNSDASVRRLKGPTRPVSADADRAEMLAALSAVDFVTVFDEDTPYELIKALTPDVLVKGGDYQIEQIVGEDLVMNRGGHVVSVDFHEGYSSTRTIEKIRVNGVLIPRP